MQEITLETSDLSPWHDPSTIVNSSTEVSLYFQQMNGVHLEFFSDHQDNIIKKLRLKIHFIGKPIFDFNVRITQVRPEEIPKVLGIKNIETAKDNSETAEVVIDLVEEQEEIADFHFECNVKFIPRKKKVSTTFTTDILEKFTKIRNDENFFDFFLKFLNEKQIRVHKFMLASKSAVFSKMFQSNLLESQTNEAVIFDVDYEVMNLLVKFMYNGKIDDFGNYLFDVLIAADKYQILDLKQICELKISTCLSFDTIADILIYADHFNAGFLKERCIEYVQSKWEALKDLKEFEKIFDYPELVLDIFKTFNICDFPIRSIISNL